MMEFPVQNPGIPIPVFMFGRQKMLEGKKNKKKNQTKLSRLFKTRRLDQKRSHFKAPCLLQMEPTPFFHTSPTGALEDRRTRFAPVHHSFHHKNHTKPPRLQRPGPAARLTHDFLCVKFVFYPIFALRFKTSAAAPSRQPQKAAVFGSAAAQLPASPPVTFEAPHRLSRRPAPLRAVPLHFVLHRRIERLPRDPPRGHLPCSETPQSSAHPAPGGPARGNGGTSRAPTPRSAGGLARPAPAGPALAEAAPRRAAAAAPHGDFPAAPALPPLPPPFPTRARRRRSANAALLRDGAELTAKVRTGAGSAGGDKE